MNQHLLRWKMFDAKLPVKSSSHDAIVYQGKLYIIGGYNWNERKPSRAIYEITFTPPSLYYQAADENDSVMKNSRSTPFFMENYLLWAEKQPALVIMLRTALLFMI